MKEINMPILHMIGDSFFAPMQPRFPLSNDEDYHKFRDLFRTTEWWNILGKKLGAESISNVSGSGTGLDWMCHRLLELLTHKQIKPQDMVIISLTHPDRKWAIEEAPWASNLSCLETESFRENLIEDLRERNELIDEVKFRVQMEAAYQYWLYCKNEKLDTYISFGLIYFMKEVCRRHNVGCFFLQSVSNMGSTENTYVNGFNTLGTLQDLAINEFKGKTWSDRQQQRDKAFLNEKKYWQGRDQRIAHLTLDNHKILADQLFESITNKTELDLTTGFNEQVIDLNEEPELHLYCKENNWDFLENKWIN